MLCQMLLLVVLLGGNDGARTHVLPNDTAAEDIEFLEAMLHCDCHTEYCVNKRPCTHQLQLT